MSIGQLIGGALGGIMGGVTSVISGGSFLEGFADGMLSGTVSGAITGAFAAGLGVAGQAVGNGVKCVSALGKTIKVTSKVTKVLSTVMDGFDTLSMAVGLFDSDNPLVQINQKLHSSIAYNIFQGGVNALAIFTGAATSTMKCFVAGTMILTAQGLVAIESIKAGNKVISTNTETFEVAEKTVLETYVRETTELVHLTINGEVIKTTYDHPFYVKDVGFINAGDLYIGDKLLDSNGNTLVVEDRKVETLDESVKVYNFQVEDFHTYHVGENGVLVHNSECGGRYADLKKTSDSSKEQVHHMPADSSSPLSKSDGVAIKMDITDHKKTASYDRKPGSDTYRKTQLNLIKDGKFQQAFDMDVADIQKKFPGKYDENLAQAQNYLDSIIKEGKVK